MDKTIEITVPYIVDEEQYERLLKITAGYKNQGFDGGPEKLFINIMLFGSKHNIDDKLTFHEKILGYSKEK